MIENFDVKSSNWSCDDRTTAEVAQSDHITLLHVMKQVITELTHIVEKLHRSYLF